MGDHHGFDASGINWWSTARTTSTSSTSFDGSSASCSAAIADISPNLIDSSLQSSGFGIDWNQSLIGSSSGRVEPSFHAMLQEPLNYHPQVHIGNQDMIDSQQFLLQGLFEPQVKHQQSAFDHRLMLNCEPPSMSMIGSNSNYHGGLPPPSDLLAQFPHFLKSSSPPKQQSSSANNLQFSNNTPFWNASYSDVSEARSGIYPSTMPVQFSSATTKSASETPQRKNEPALKKPRIETPSPLPTFKVRKEKLGDRITALQQLVSPFGKTDTASVLHEAIEYIKFLHDQVNVFTTPYFKNGHPMQHQQGSNKSKDDEGPKQDLRSRGLCLVPIESTYPVATETTADFWTPTFGGSFR